VPGRDRRRLQRCDRLDGSTRFFPVDREERRRPVQLLFLQRNREHRLLPGGRHRISGNQGSIAIAKE
jgi:hypothetical protein